MTLHRPIRLALVLLAFAIACPAGAQTAAPPAKAPTSITVPAAKAPVADELPSPLVDESPAAAAVLSARAPLNPRDLRLIQDQLQRVIAQVLPATVSVELGRAAGSGVIVSADGLVLTAAHVIGRPGRIAWIELPDGRRLRGRTLGANHEADAGMIRLENPPADLPFAPMSKRELSVGEWVVTTGQPGGIVTDRAPPVRLGRVLVALDDMVCTDCKLVGGDSGGPLFNMRGEVVAIHSSIGPMITHNFHVPAAAFREGWDRLLAGELWGGRFDEVASGRPMIGVSGRTEAGRCLITQVYPGMPADEAGVEPGDVITAVDGRPIAGFDQLSNIVSFKVPGQKIKLTIDRDGESFDLEVPLARVEARPAPEDDDD